MKRNIIIFFAIGLLMTLGCKKLQFGNDFLTKAPGVDVTIDTVFKNLEYAERFLWGAYSTLRYGLNTSDDENWQHNMMRRDLTATLTDEAQGLIQDWGAQALYYSGAYNATVENTANAVPWQNPVVAGNTRYNLTLEGSFDGIRRCYIFIKNIDRVPDVDPAYRKQLKAEAMMIIACHYSDMYRNFGGLPWINHAYTIAEATVSVQISRLTAQQTCDSIVALCDRAAVDLPWIVTDDENWDGRFTKAGAMGAKARILLFNASPIFNAATPFLDGAASQQKLTWHGAYDANLWKKAMDAANDLITQAEATGDYKIYKKAGNSFRQDFQDAYYLRGNGEMLISTRYTFRSPTGASSSYFIYQVVGWGISPVVTDDYVKLFPMSNGKLITDPTSGYDSTNPYINRDPRLYETALCNGDNYRSRTAELWIGGRERTTIAFSGAITGYPLRKFLLDNNTATSYGSIVHWPYLRLAEIYLSYAEADNEFNNGPDAEAYRCINIVRNRVGIGNLPAGLTRDQFREAVIHERSCELAFEENRWYDLIRWKRDFDFTKHLHGMNIYRQGTGPYTYTYTRYELGLRYWMANWSPKWYLAAFPADEINKGYGLVQNPGWE